MTEEDDLEMMLLASLVEKRIGVEHPSNCKCSSCSRVSNDGPNGICQQCGVPIDDHAGIDTKELKCPVAGAR